MVLYNGFGTIDKAQISGRVLEDKGLARPGKKESSWRKLKRSYRVMESDEIADAELELKVLGRTISAKSDDEGLFQVTLKGPLPVGCHPVRARLKDRLKFRVDSGSLTVWPKKPGLVVISDIDDTILQTGVKDKMKMIKKVLLSNARDLKTYRHASALYRVWSKRGYPIIFVSGSPINLYTRLTRFLSLQGFPVAPLRLKKLGAAKGADSLWDQKQYKLRQITATLDLLPKYSILLVGDSGEQDPEIYRQVMKKYPRQVKGVFIHNVSGEDPQALRFKEQTLFKSYGALAKVLQLKSLLTVGELKLIDKAP